VDFEQPMIPDEINGFLWHTSWLRAYHAATDFFDRKLQASAGKRLPVHRMNLIGSTPRRMLLNPAHCGQPI
jgi:hypothetical protein